MAFLMAGANDLTFTRGGCIELIKAASGSKSMNRPVIERLAAAQALLSDQGIS